VVPAALRHRHCSSGRWTCSRRRSGWARPVEVRRRNLIASGQFPYETPTGLTLDGGEYEAGLDRLLGEAGYEALREEQVLRRASKSHTQLGIGFGLFIDRTAGFPAPEYGSAELREDGGLRVLTGSSPYGQGHDTAWAMLASDRTGIPMAQIEVVHGDTNIVPRGSVTGGSRSAQVAGTAVMMAADALVHEVRNLAAELLEASVEDVVLDIERARFHVVGAPSANAIGWAELAAASADELPRCETDFTSGQGSFPSGAYLAVVEVDTGRVDLRRMVTVDDAGTILNPLLALGQVHGGVAQGIAQALWEEFVYDEDGNPKSGNFIDYHLHSAAELPSFECTLVETPSPLNPLGFKGIRESGCLGAAPAVHNAVIDALSHLGVRHIDMPLTPNRVWSAIREVTSTT
jgi:carbon-monoxide dehydrogenase large subunit